MKKLFIPLFASFLLFACNNGNNKTTTAGQEEHEHTSADTALALNNGAKWKSDSITNHNVVMLKTVADNFRAKPFPSSTDYQLLGGDLAKSLDQLINQCKMSGPDHEALHKWLNPILKTTGVLKTITDTASGRAAFKSLDSRIDAFHDYFE